MLFPSPRPIRFILLSALAIFLGSGSALPAASVQDFAWHESRDTLEFTFEFDGRVIPKSYDRLDDKGYYYIDFYGADQPREGADWKFDYPGLRHVKRLYYPSNDPQMRVIRYVFYPRGGNIKTFFRFDGLGRKFSLVLSYLTVEVIKPAAPAVKSSNRKLVIIDPGHGGSSPGAKTSRAINGRYLLEKDIALTIAKKLKKLIDQSPNLEARMTRTGDQTVSLDERIDFADRSNGDLFVSIHLNATQQKKKTGRGFEVYYLDSVSKAAHRELEHLENENGYGEGSPGAGRSRAALDSMAIQKISRKRLESYTAALVMNNVFRREGPFRYAVRGVKAANFRVLMNYNMPSILVECGFIDNPDDAALVADNHKQDEIATLLFNSISLYFARMDSAFKARTLPMP